MEETQQQQEEPSSPDAAYGCEHRQLERLCPGELMRHEHLSLQQPQRSRPHCREQPPCAAVGSGKKQRQEPRSLNLGTMALSHSPLFFNIKQQKCLLRGLCWAGAWSTCAVPRLQAKWEKANPFPPAFLPTLNAYMHTHIHLDGVLSSTGLSTSSCVV